MSSTDGRIRSLERQARSGDESALALLLREKSRAGERSSC